MRITCWQLIAVLFSLGVAHAEPRITEAVLGHDRIQKQGSYEIVKPATVFAPNAAKIVCVFRVEGAGIGMNIESVWIAEDVGRAAPPNYKIAELGQRLLVEAHQRFSSRLLPAGDLHGQQTGQDVEV